MRISRVQIENFRSVRHLDLSLPQYCALVGPNNSGKSNILTAIYKVLGRDWLSVSSFSEHDVFARRRDLDVKIKITLDPPSQYQKFKGGPPAAVPVLSFEYTRYKIGVNKGEPRLEQRCLRLDGLDVQVLSKAPKKGEPHQYQPLTSIPGEVKDAVPLIYIGSSRSLREQLPSARYSLLRQMLDDVDHDFRDPENKVTVKRGENKIEISRAERFAELITKAMNVLRTSDFEALEASIKRNALEQLGVDPVGDADQLDLYFSPFDSLDFYRSLELLVREKEFEIRATELGEGMQNALVLAILQAYEERRKKGAILLIEEPEMFLHPQKQRALARTLRRIAETNQVILTTHSPHFVAVPDYRNVFIIRKPDDGTVATASSLPAGTISEEKLRKELDPERNEMFFANRVLFVEGDTEKLAFPEYAKRLGIDLDRAGASIVEVGGKRSLVDFTRIALSFGISTGLVYDEDSSDFDKKQKAEEEQYNATLDSIASHGARVWRLPTKYEVVLRNTLGDAMHEQAKAKYPGASKAVRARLIAADHSFKIPDIIAEVLHWLGGEHAAVSKSASVD
jgi:Predicted ATP-dependent endonuclease of the OLD family